MLRRGLKRTLATTLCASMLLSTAGYAETVTEEREILETQFETKEIEVVETEPETEETEVVETEPETEETEAVETESETEEVQIDNQPAEDTEAVLAEGEVAINEENFPDPAFREYISSNLEFYDSTDGILSVEEMDNVERLHIWSENIKNLKGIEYFKNLKYLGCHDNRLTSLDLSSNTELEELSCWGNSLTELDLSHNTKLTMLSCDNNKLTQLELNQNTKLVEISCSYNNLKQLDVSNLVNLERVSCSNNLLEEIKLGNHPNLTDFTCNDNQLTQLDISGCQNLEDFRCGNNSIQSLDFSNYAQLEYLSCYNNVLKELKFGNNSNLIEISCRNNALTQLDVSGCQNLEYLYCGDNLLEQLKCENNATLIRLNCDGNKLTGLDVSGCSNLEELECGNNTLKELKLGSNPRLTALRCYDNELTQLDVSGCINLKNLSCSRNKLKDLDITKNTALQDLYCSDNGLSHLDLANNSRLTSLSCGGNQMTELDLSSIVKLSSAGISYQYIEMDAKELADGQWEIDLSKKISPERWKDVTVSEGTYNPKTGKIVLPDDYSYYVDYSIKTGLQIAGSGAENAKELKVQIKPTYKRWVFEDVPKTAWYYSAVKYVYENGLITGTSDTTFSPNDPMTRGMLVSVLYRLAGRPAVSGKNQFSDVSSSKYYAKAIQWASENGIVSGYSNGKFGPEDPITREQMTKIFYQFVKMNGGDVSHSADVSVYKDADQIASYAARYVKWAVADGILKGSNGNLNPKGNATRAEVSAIMKRVIETYKLK